MSLVVDVYVLNQSCNFPEIEKHSIVDLERDILKYAFKHYISFMEYHFGLSGPSKKFSYFVFFIFIFVY